MSESQPDGEVEERRLAAIMAADIAGYGRLMGADEVATLQALKSHRAAIEPIIARYRGRLVRTTGDGMLVEFVSAIDAVQCAVDIQRCMTGRNADTLPDRRIEFRIGINVSDIIGDAGDIYGDGVNVAARLEAMAEPGGICVSRAVRDPVRDKLALDFEDLGEVAAKNIARPIHAFRVRLEGEAAVAEPPAAPKRWTPQRSMAAAALFAVLCVAGGAWYSILRTPGETPPVATAAITNPALRAEAPPIGAPPRLSLVVLPFENAPADPADPWLVDGVTDDLTRDLGNVPGLFVIARASAFSYRSKAMFVRRIATELGVRYAVEGSVRRNGPALHVTAMLVSTESGAQLWSGEFDEAIDDLPQGQERIAARIREALGIAPAEASAARPPPATREAYALILQARAALRQRPAPQSLTEAERLYELALQRQPDAVLALAGAAFALIEANEPPAREKLDRAAQYIARTQAIAPDEEPVLIARVALARARNEWPVWAAAATRLVSLHPNARIGNEQLAAVRMLDGKLDDAIALMKTAMRLNPRDPQIQLRYGRVAWLLALAGRDKEALDWAHWALAGSDRELSSAFRATMHLIEATAFARTGDADAAHRALAEAQRLTPFDTVRSHGPVGRASVEHQAQIRAWQDALRLAGYRDHADPDADFHLPADSRLHETIVGQTPKTAPGATTIATADLAKLLAGQKPLVIDAMSPNNWYRSIPGAVGLPGSGLGDELKGPVQDRLGQKLHTLTGGNTAMPIVAVGWNSERFDGRNLALRLVALGYSKVYWYRGGLEAWEVAAQPEAELAPQDW